jgi:hypothetical protein
LIASLLDLYEQKNEQQIVHFFQWQLVCDRAQLVNVAEMMFLAGVAAGGLVSGMVSDR